jgi:outer membrane protein, multidrug efflux system
LDVVNENIKIQSNALDMVRLQKVSARVTELAVRRFEAQVFNTKSLRFEIQQRIVETENLINFLVGRFPQPVLRISSSLLDLVPDSLEPGLPNQLLDNRPDIRQAEFELAATKLDVTVAKANFYPSFGISAGLGLEAFNSKFLMKSPESMLYQFAGDAVGPLINRKAIKATYNNANAKQLQAVYNYERTILSAYIEVTNVLSRIQNLEKQYDLKSKRVSALTESVDISLVLFSSARADYMEVLLTQRDALESKFELIETKNMQMAAYVKMYQAIGGGWR